MGMFYRGGMLLRCHLPAILPWITALSSWLRIGHTGKILWMDSSVTLVVGTSVSNTTGLLLVLRLSPCSPLPLCGSWFLGWSCYLAVAITSVAAAEVTHIPAQPYALSLVLLILFTCAAIIGCVVLYTSQGKFHSSTSKTVDYVVGQANFTVDNLRNFSESLAEAKKITVDQVFLPADVQSEIDSLKTKVNSSATELASRTLDNSRKISRVLDRVRLDLIIIAAVMLLLAFIGFLLSILGLQFLVYILVVVGWILVTGTFILCGVFLLLHNVVADTCVAMNDWVDHPHAHTALDDILPCIDVATANESLYRSREVTFQLVSVVNRVIVNVSNGNFPPSLVPLYYNQSGPLMPTLCNPFTPDLNNRTCTPGEVDFNNASQVWKGYVCQSAVVSGSEICTTVGRVTPSIYNQMTAAVTVSRGLYYYVPFLTQLEDCSFVRETFTGIHENNCPGLEQSSKRVYIGLVMVSGAVMLSLIFWVIYARERRHRTYNKQFLVETGRPHLPLQEKVP
ncbi:unnamed protein product [Musa textilis]